MRKLWAYILILLVLSIFLKTPTNTLERKILVFGFILFENLLKKEQLCLNIILLRDSWLIFWPHCWMLQNLKIWENPSGCAIRWFFCNMCFNMYKLLLIVLLYFYSYFSFYYIFFGGSQLTAMLSGGQPSSLFLQPSSR